MGWTRQELKQRAREALSRNYWRIVLVSLIGILIGGAASRAGASSSIGENISDNIQYNVEKSFGEAEVDLDYFDIGEFSDRINDAATWDDVNSIAYIAFFALVIMIIEIIGALLGAVFNIFLINPIKIGISRFMLKSIDDTGRISEVGYAFDHNYLNAVKVMFLKGLFVGLWTLVFVIPGIYKLYQYRMVAYILAENPDMPYQEVLQRSKDIMNGQKWDAFVLDVSFLLWHILGAITCGMAEIFYVAPYVNLTNAALYRQLTQMPQQIEGELNHEL